MSWVEDEGYFYDPPEQYNDYDDSIFKQYLLHKLFWKCKDGSKINVLDMKSSHILNCIRIPQYPNKADWDIVFNYELKRRK